MLRRCRPRFDLLVSIGCVAMLGYFAWHAWYGPRGWAHAARLDAELQALQAELADFTQQKQHLEAKVSLLRPESVDADLLDELARNMLGWAGKNDLIARLP